LNFLHILKLNFTRLGRFPLPSAQGVILLSVYSLGLGIPLLLAAIFTDRLCGWLCHLGRTAWLLKIGPLPHCHHMGIAMITGQITARPLNWLLETLCSR
jgi:cytochrome c-type biogenesis protein